MDYLRDAFLCLCVIGMEIIQYGYDNLSAIMINFISTILSGLFLLWIGSRLFFKYQEHYKRKLEFLYKFSERSNYYYALYNNLFLPCFDMNFNINNYTKDYNETLVIIKHMNDIMQPIVPGCSGLEEIYKLDFKVFERIKGYSSPGLVSAYKKNNDLLDVHNTTCNLLREFDNLIWKEIHKMTSLKKL